MVIKFGWIINRYKLTIRVLGGEDALNLDGGGSTTLWLSGASDNGVVNYPCDNGRFDHAGERKVPNILYITHQ